MNKHINTTHFIFWGIYSLILFFTFRIILNTNSSVVRTTIILSLQLCIFYINLKWILPQFYEKKKYKEYISINSILLIIGVLISSILPDRSLLVDHHLSTGFVLEVLIIHTMPIFVTIFASFFIYTSHKRKLQEKKEFAILAAEKSFLIQQINPHFLFNTLNNIYFLTYKTSPEGSKAIMQLSKLLDYSLYGVKEGKVNLSEEIDYINNFISLYKLKDHDISNISFDYQSANTNQNIAPMLLIPFVENALKHGNIEDSDKGHISIKLSSNKNRILFECKNSYLARKVVDKTGGIGIKNVTRRLELIYPNMHKLEIKPNEGLFIVQLKISLNA